MGKVLVTGGSGFIGSALVKRLVDTGRDVRVFDNNVRGSRSKLGEYVDRVDFVEGDIRDRDMVEQAVEGCEVVHHLAYINGTRFFYEKPHTVLEVAVKGTMNIIDAVVAHGVDRLLYASSSEVYQTPKTVPTDETAELSIPDVTNPRYSYGGGKILGELLCVNYSRHYDFEAVVYRPHNVFGPDMGFEHVLPEFAKKLHAILQGSTTFAVEGTGKETRAFCHVDDFVDGLMIAAEKGESGSIYNIGDDRLEISIGDLARRCMKVVGVDAKLVFEPEKPGATPRRCPDISKLGGLGYAPSRDFDTALKATLDWYLRKYAQREG